MTKYGDISNWDTSSVTNMNHMFHYAESFNQPLNKWNVSKVTSMNAMFYRAPSFNQPLNNWNVSKVTNMWTRSRFDRLWFGFSPRVAVPGGSA